MIVFIHKWLKKTGFAHPSSTESTSDFPSARYLPRGRRRRKTNRDVISRSKYSRGKLGDSDDDVYVVICYVVLCSSEQALDNPADEKDVIVQRESDHYLSENGSLFWSAFPMFVPSLSW